jgi:hypothetical protein
MHELELENELRAGFSAWEFAIVLVFGVFGGW